MKVVEKIRRVEVSSEGEREREKVGVGIQKEERGSSSGGCRGEESGRECRR